MTNNDVADSIRNAMVDAARRAYDDAGVPGLCAEGRWEAAVSALRSVNIALLLREMPEVSRSTPPMRSRGAEGDIE